MDEINSISTISNNTNYIFPVILVSLLLLLTIWMFFLPFRCGKCLKFHTIRSIGASVAGEYIIHKAWCNNCKTKLQVDSAGYLVTDVKHIFRRAIPKDF